MKSPRNQFDRSRQALAGLDALLQHRLRLGICVLLAEADHVSFSRLKELLGSTDGNLGAQLRKLEDTGYVAVDKQFVRRRPVSRYSLLGPGRKALDAHLAAMEAIVEGSRGR